MLGPCPTIPPGGGGWSRSHLRKLLIAKVKRVRLAGMVSRISTFAFDSCRGARVEIISFNKDLGTKERTKSLFSNQGHSRSQFLTAGMCRASPLRMRFSR